jgi:hypothetical protein
MRDWDWQELLGMAAPVHIGRGHEERPAKSLEIHESKVIIDRHVTPASGTGTMETEAAAYRDNEAVSRPWPTTALNSASSCCCR